MDPSLKPREYPRNFDSRIASIHADSSDAEQARPTIESLEESLYDSQNRTEEGKFFIPEGTLEHILDEDTIRLAIGESLPALQMDNVSQYAWKICHSVQPFRKILAILVLSDMIENIVRFVDLHINDSYLPMPDPRPFGTNDSSRICTTKVPHIECDRVFKGRRSRQLNFFRSQWTVLSPVFRSEDQVNHFSFSHDYILPFLHSDFGISSDAKSRMDIVKDQTRCGGYSEVRSVKLHPAHGIFGDYGVSNPDSVFALKRLNTLDDYKLWQEVNVLKRFRNVDHIIQLLATFEINDGSYENSPSSYYLIFPWATGDLASLWEAKQNFVGDYRIASWISKQSSALAKALSTIHNDSYQNTKDHSRLYGRHGDIKPSNILWFSASSIESSVDFGQLVLSDFGLADFRSERSRSALAASTFARSAKYRAPEFDIEGGKMSRGIDIWMLGCTYLEFVTWYLMGVDAVFNEFRKARSESDIYGIDADTFFRIMEVDGRPTGIVKAQVTTWIASLHEQAKCSDYMHDFLELIKQHMLVADPKSRWTAAKVSHRLEELKGRCQDNDRYVRIENAWTGRRDSLKSENGMTGHHKNMLWNALRHKNVSRQKDQ